jgi:hypothetical protein
MRYLILTTLFLISCSPKIESPFYKAKDCLSIIGYNNIPIYRIKFISNTKYYFEYIANDLGLNNVVFETLEYKTIPVTCPGGN